MRTITLALLVYSLAGRVFEGLTEAFDIRVGDYQGASGEAAAVAVVAEPEAQGAIVNLE